MTDPRNLRVRRCDCSECLPMRPDSPTLSQDDRSDTPDWMLDEDEPRDWSRAGRAPAEIPLRSRIWGTER